MYENLTDRELWILNTEAKKALNGEKIVSTGKALMDRTDTSYERRYQANREQEQRGQGRYRFPPGL